MSKENTLDETVDLASRELPFKEKSELGEVFENMDSDKVNEQGMSNIDFNARLKDWEAQACIIVDELQTLGILPTSVNLTRLKKRISVSLDGKGRQEKVQVASASHSASILGKAGGGGGWFTPRGKE